MEEQERKKDWEGEKGGQGEGEMGEGEKEDWEGEKEGGEEEGEKRGEGKREEGERKGKKNLFTWISTYPGVRMK